MNLKIYWPMKPYVITQLWGAVTDAYSNQFNDPNFKRHNGIDANVGRSGDTAYLRSEIERMRYQLQRQRKEIRALQKAGIPTKSAEDLLERMLAKIDALCAERDRKRREEAVKYPGTDKPIRGAIERRIR